MGINIQNLMFGFDKPNGFSFKISDLSLVTGQTYVLLGPSGSGKSTLLNLLSGILRPNSGLIEIAGQNLRGVTAAHMDRFRGENIGFIFQTLNLIPWLSAHDNIALALAFAPGRRARLNGALSDNVNALAQSMQIEERLLAQPAGQLSIGQQQRVAAARALIGAPSVILADEPSSALDAANTKLFFELLIGSLDTARQTLLVVSHDAPVTNLFDHTLMVDDIIENRGNYE